MAIENVTEVVFNRGQCFLGSIARNNHFVEIVEASQFINAVDMIGMRVGIEDAVDVLDAISQALLAEVR